MRTPPPPHQCHSKKIKLMDLTFTRSGLSASQHMPWILNSNQTPCLLPTLISIGGGNGIAEHRDSGKISEEIVLEASALWCCILLGFIRNRGVSEKIKETSLNVRRANDLDQGRMNVITVIDSKRKTIEEYSREGPAERVLRLYEGGKGCYFCTS